MTFFKRMTSAAIVLLCASLVFAPAAVTAAKAGQTSNLIDAASSGDLAKVKALLAAGADVNAKSVDGETALIAASSGRLLTPSEGHFKHEGHPEVVRALLAAKADVNAKKGNGYTALMGSSENGHLAVVRALLAANADVNAKTFNGTTALILASKGSLSAWSKGHPPVREGHLEIVQALLVAKAEVNASDGNGRTALMFASGNGHLQIVRALLAAGADVNAKMSNNATALMAASDGGHQEIVQLLTKAGSGNSGASSISSALSANRGNTKFVCSSGIESGNPGAIQFVYELKSDGRVYASTNLSPIGTAGTYSIDGNRIIIVINGNSVVYGFTNGVLSMGAGIDCKKVE